MASIPGSAYPSAESHPQYDFYQLTNPTEQINLVYSNSPDHDYIFGDFNIGLTVNGVAPPTGPGQVLDGTAMVNGAGTVLTLGTGNFDVTDVDPPGNTITLGSGNQTVTGAAGDTVIGGTGVGYIVGDSTPGAQGDSLVGGSNAGTSGGLTPSTAGTDLIGYAGDTITGGPVSTATEFIDASRGPMSVNGGASTNTIYSGTGDTITGGSGTDYIVGHSGDTINGGSGNEFINAGNTDTSITGADTVGGHEVVNGGDGSDFIVGGPDDSITGGSNADSIIGASGDTIQGGLGHELIDGTAGFQGITGGGNDDSIYGGAGDTITGGSGGAHTSFIQLHQSSGHDGPLTASEYIGVSSTIGAPPVDDTVSGFEHGTDFITGAPASPGGAGDIVSQSYNPTANGPTLTLNDGTTITLVGIGHQTVDSSFFS